MIWVLAAATPGCSEDNVLNCEAGVHGFESALSLNIAPFFLSFFSQKFLSFYAGPLALLTASGCRTSSHCLTYYMKC